ncbi:MAG: hypothetical protein M1812_004685 [Candelaria pacifica]|nr:MAG: hypothetical protein M1812_004685 [Candelaria pacifica]
MTDSPSNLSTDKMPTTRITVLISGNGTNLQALIDASKSGSLPNSVIVRVVSNRRKAFGLTRAENANIKTTYHNLLKYKKDFPDPVEDGTFNDARRAYDQDLAARVLVDKPDLVVCAGWMHILAPEFLEPVKAANVPVINLHPALPGQYNGANAIQRAYADFQAGNLVGNKTGVMIHHVIAQVDMGEPILTKEVLIAEGESLVDLETRIHKDEWKAIVEGTRTAIERLWQERGLKSC